MFKLGLIASDNTQLSGLQRLVGNSSHQAVFIGLIKDIQLPLTKDVEVWVLRIANFDEKAEALLGWLDKSELPVVIDDLVQPLDEMALVSASKNLASKIATAASDIRTTKRQRRVPDRVWALGASAGGPEAVIAFFKSLPASAAKHAFLYAQHIDDSGFPLLVSSLEKQSKLQVKVCSAGMPLEAGTLYVVPLDTEINIEVGCYFAMPGEEWKGAYRPSIDQVFAKVAKAFRKRSGVIVFSGMGRDGSDALLMVKAAGGAIYAQSPESCAIDAMPDSAIETGCVDLVASVEELARAVST